MKGHECSMLPLFGETAMTPTLGKQNGACYGARASTSIRMRAPRNTYAWLRVLCRAPQTAVSLGVDPSSTGMLPDSNGAFVECRGRLVYPSPLFHGAGHNCGRMPCNFGCDPLTQAIPPFHVSDGHINIVMLDRVPGDFVCPQALGVLT